MFVTTGWHHFNDACLFDSCRASFLIHVGLIPQQILSIDDLIIRQWVFVWIESCQSSWFMPHPFVFVRSCDLITPQILSSVGDWSIVRWQLFVLITYFCRFVSSMLLLCFGHISSIWYFWGGYSILNGGNFVVPGLADCLTEFIPSYDPLQYFSVLHIQPSIVLSYACNWRVLRSDPRSSSGDL
jgi:hypothetical protein